MHIEICLVDCTWGDGVKYDPNSSPVFSNNFRATKKLKAHASSTKSQQLRALKFLFYTALQITFLFSLVIPAASTPAQQDCFTRPTSFNRSCTRNDVL